MSRLNDAKTTAVWMPLEEAEEMVGVRAEEAVYVASHWKLMWWKFRKHKMALVCLGILGILYAVALFCEFLAPCDPNDFAPQYIYMPPQPIHFVDENGFHLRPFVCGVEKKIDLENFATTYTPMPTDRYPIHLFVHGYSYKFLGLFETDIHLFGLKDDKGTIFLLGADRLGRDVLSRIIYGTRTSLSIGVIGVFLSLILGVVIGGFSGYYGGMLDVIIQRVIEFLRSVPTIPLWMALSAALPDDWPSLRIYFGITVILSFVGWTGLARVVRGRFLALREEEFVMAAELAGASKWWVITRHLIPSITSHLIASLTLAFPGMILGETSLSFLGIGLRPPVVSWGVMLKSAQRLSVVALSPWLLTPAIFVVLAMLSFNFVGDGLRDAADPYAG